VIGLWLACHGATWVKGDGDAPLELGAIKTALFVEDEENDESRAEASLLLVDGERDCDDALGEWSDYGTVLYDGSGLTFDLLWSTSADDPAAFAWEGTWVSGYATAYTEARLLTGWLFADGWVHDAGNAWVEVTEHDSDVVEGTFDSRWYKGAFEAENCGVGERDSEDGEETGA
jgi:hypothetical protein